MGDIISEGNVRDLFDKDGNFLGINSDHWIDQALDDVRWDEGGRIGASNNELILKKNKFDILRDRRRAFYSMSGKETYLENVKRLMQKITINKREFTIMMSIAMNRGNRIEYTNPTGILYGVKYLIAHYDYKENELKKVIKEIIEDAEKNEIGSFDIIRYFRFVIMYNRYPILGNIRTVIRQNIRFEKIPYKAVVKKREEIDE
jgi:hypothetical protein